MAISMRSNTRRPTTSATAPGLPRYARNDKVGTHGALVTVQTCGDLPTIGPIVEGQPSTVFPLQTVSVPSNVNSYGALVLVDVRSRFT